MKLTKFVCRSVVLFILATLIGTALMPSPSFAQTDTIKALIENAEAKYKQGEDSFNKGQKDIARQKFDESVDLIMLSGINLRANPKLDAYYTDLVERIHSFDIPKNTRAANNPTVTKPGVEVLNQQNVNTERSAIDEIASEVNENELSAVTAAGLKVYGKYDFDFSVAPPVFQFLNFFTSGRGRSTMLAGLQRSGRYRLMVEKIFKEEGVPLDLMWLAQAESVWKPNALSRAAAKGIWQFISSTGSRYGLVQTAYVDERSHPEKSTRAAARYLKWLHEHFAGDWLLAMAAYNSGENRVDNAVAKCGYADFWELYTRGLLPQETRNYVPIILAITIITKNQNRYGFSVKPDAPLLFEATEIPDQTDLRVVSDLTSLPYDVVQELNPELRKGCTPPGQSYTIRLPKGYKQVFELSYAGLPEDQRMRRPSVARDDDDKPERVERAERPAYRPTYTTKVVGYQVRRGDTLASVAQRHGVSVKEVARINRMSSRGELLRGQTLKVPSNVRSKSKSAAKKQGGRTASKSKSRRR